MSDDNKTFMGLPLDEVAQIIAIYKVSGNCEKDYNAGFMDGVKYAENEFNKALQRCVAEWVDEEIVKGTEVTEGPGLISMEVE